MGKFFNVDSKAMQFLGKISDMILMNLVFFACCIPIVTIGAAQAGLCRAVVALHDRESDIGWFRAFVQGFKNGFWKITIASSLLLIFILAVGINAVGVLVYETAYQAEESIMWMCGIGAGLLMVFHSSMTLFHSKFGCSVLQLFRNAVVLTLFNPLQALIHGVLMWMPLIVLLVNANLFVQITPLWLLGYYPLACSLTMLLFKVPFQVLINNYNEQNGITEEAADLEEEE